MFPLAVLAGRRSACGERRLPRRRFRLDGPLSIPQSPRRHFRLGWASLTTSVRVLLSEHQGRRRANLPGTSEGTAVVAAGRRPASGFRIGWVSESESNVRVTSTRARRQRANTRKANCLRHSSSLPCDQRFIGRERGIRCIPVSMRNLKARSWSRRRPGGAGSPSTSAYQPASAAQSGLTDREKRRPVGG